MIISYVILTHNRRDVLLRTLKQLPAVTRLSPQSWEAIVADNASTDGTAQALAAAFPWVRLVRLDSNLGSPGRNAGAAVARGDWLVFLDDDSWPRPGSIALALDYLRKNPGVAVLGGPVWLPDGQQDGSALPLVPPGCGMMVQRSVFMKVDGFSPVIFQRAEEYDLVFRIVQAGFQVHRLDTLEFEHEKTSVSRQPIQILQWDLINNLLLVWRYLPSPHRARLRRDWLRRYVALLHHAGGDGLVVAALRQARRLLAIERSAGRPTLSHPAIESLFGFEHASLRVTLWATRHKIRKVAIGDHSKTTWVAWNACLTAGLRVVAISDDHPAYRGMKYRGVPIVSDAQAAGMAARGEIDAVVLSNMNPAKVEQRAASLQKIFQVPVLALWPIVRSSAAGVGQVPAAGAGNGIGA